MGPRERGLPRTLTELERFRTVEELGVHVALVARVRAHADESDIWVHEPGGMLRSMKVPQVVCRSSELGLDALPAEGAATSAPGAWRGRLAWQAIPLTWGETPVGVLTLGYAASPPSFEAVQSDLTALLPVWTVALDRLVVRAQLGQVDAVATARVGAGLAHTLSNVLQAAISATEDARARAANAGGVSADARASLEDSLEARRRAAGLVQQLAVLGGQADEVSPVEVRALAAGLVAALRRQMPAGIDLVLHAHEDEAWIEVDRRAIEATLAGVIHAAREALGSFGQIRVATRVTTDASGGSRMVVVEIHRQPAPSNGLTPFPAALPQSPDNKGGDSHGAARLGLTFARVAVARYGGSVTELPATGGGTVVTLALPGVRLAPRRSISGTLLRAQGAEGTRVLVADDDPAVLRGVARILQSAGHEVLTARDGAEALALARSTPGLDVALIDLTMPRLAGPALVAALRRVAHGMPVVVMTGYAAEEMVEALRREGVVEVLRKPVEARRLLSALTDAMAAAAG